MSGKFCKVVKQVTIGIILVLGLWYIGYKVCNVTESSVQFGTLMDTVIAVSNAIMAGCAIYASRKWFKQKKKENTALKVEQILQAGTNLIAILNAVKSNIQDNLPDLLKLKAPLLIQSYNNFKSAKLCLHIWGKEILINEFKDDIDFILKESFIVYDKINSPEKRAVQLSDKNVIERIDNIVNRFNTFQDYEIEKIVSKLN